MALKRSLSIILCAVMLLSVLTGCSLFGGGSDNPSGPTGGDNNPASTNGVGNNSNGSTPSGNNNGDDDNSNSGDFDVTDPFVLNYDWNNFDPADFIEPLGDATFTVDNANSATGEFLADDETPLSLSVTDGAGATWTLDIPAFALLSPETITMTVLSDIKLGGDDLDGGILLSPDGLTFIQPATLTVTGIGCDEDSVIFEGGHDGKNTTFTEYESGDGWVSAAIWHFSTRVKTNGNFRGATVSMLELLVDMGKEILRQPLEAPEPPSISFKCPEFHSIGNRDKHIMINDYLREVMDPELVARQTIKRAIANYRGQDAILAQAMDMVMKLEQRFADKINMLINRYKYQEDKLTVIFTLAVVGDWNKDGQYGIAYEEIYIWIAEVWNELMRELVEDHDYSRMHGLFILKGVVKNIYALRSIDLDTAGFERRLSNALTFRVEWELLTDVTSSGAFHSKTNSSGETVISMDKISENNGYFGEGTGNARIDSYSLVNDGKGVNLPSFNNNARLSNLDPCMSKKIMVGFDKFDEGVDFTVQYPSGTGGNTSMLPPAGFYDKYNRAEGFYEFECTLTNLKENCVDEKITGSFTQGAKLDWTLTISLFHAPKEDVFMR